MTDLEIVREYESLKDLFSLQGYVIQSDNLNLNILKECDSILKNVYTCKTLDEAKAWLYGFSHRSGELRVTKKQAEQIFEISEVLEQNTIKYSVDLGDIRLRTFTVKDCADEYRALIIKQLTEGLDCPF